MSVSCVCEDNQTIFFDPYTHPDTKVVYAEEIFPGKGADLETFYSRLDLACDCIDMCKSDTCSCINELGLNYVNGLLTDDKLFNQKSVLECNSLCKCFPVCNNVVVQRGPSRTLRIQKTEKKGYGVYSVDTIEKGSFICEYAGEIIGETEAIKRYKVGNHMNYILLLREHCSRSTIQLIVDATDVGNVGRYINHSCSPNCVIVPVRVGSPVPRLGIFAGQRIEKNEEVTYSYGSSDSRPSTTPCYCGKELCRGYLPHDEVFLDEKTF